MGNLPDGQMELIAGGTEPLPKAKNARKKAKEIAGEHLPPNLAKPVKVRVPDFSDPKRPKTCLEVDFPIVPINALSALEGNAGKPIYQMSKWWARRRSCVFRAMLIAAGMEAPTRKGPDGKPILDEHGVPIPDETEAAKAVWDVYYANHQKAENFKHLKVLDCFMGGGTTLVEGSRLGLQMSGVDLNPVAWFIVKNELACTDPEEVKRFFDQIEAEVKPQIQPFYVTDCPRGHKGKWFRVSEPGAPATGQCGTGVPAVDDLMPPDFDPCTLSPDERRKYRYEGPEVIYTFWAKHGPCVRPDCDHRTPIFRSPVIAEKKLGVKYMELTCKQCKTAFHAELGSARMAPGAERVVLDNEYSFTELSQPFAKRLLDYAKGNKNEKFDRVFELLDMVDAEPGLMCPNCGTHAGQWLRNVLTMHKSAERVSDIDKKHLKILPARNGTKPVYCYLLIHPDWLKGSPGSANGQEFGGYIDAPVEDTAAWCEERLRNLMLIEVRGRIKLSEDTSHLGVADAEPEPEADDDEVEAVDEEGADADAEDRKTYGLPRFITLSNGKRIDTRRGTVPKKSTVACGHCGQPADCLDTVKTYTESKKAQRSAPTAVYAIQGYCPDCDADGHIYSGRFFSALSASDAERLINAEREWTSRREADLKDWWPRSELPYTWMTHHLNGGIPNWGFTHWYKMFNPRQLLAHAQLLHAIEMSSAEITIRDFALASFQQYLRNQSMFCMWNVQADKLEPFFANPHYHPKQQVVENAVFGSLGRGNWRSCRGTAEEAAEWCLRPWEKAIANGSATTKGIAVATDDPVLGESAIIDARSCTELEQDWGDTLDAVITDPPFGDNLFYGDLSNFFYVWLRLALKDRYPGQFGPEFVPRSQEAVADRSRFPDDGKSEEENGLSPANQFYQSIMTACWREAKRTLKDGGTLAFTFHHSAYAPWVSVLASLFDAGFILEATYPISSDETKGEGGQFGSRKIEYDIIHVCRKRLEEPQPVSWPKMRQWVKAELKRLRRLLESYKTRELSEADIRVILCGKALEFYSRHYGKVYTAEDAVLSIRDALSGIDQLLDEDTGEPGERPPSILQPLCYKFLWLFGGKASLSRDEVGKSLRGTGLVQRELSDRGWVEEKNKVVYRVPIKEQFEKSRQRPRKEMQTEIDQAHFLIGAALPGSGLNIEEELSRNTWAVRRSVEAVLLWYARTAVEPEIKDAAALAATLLRKAIETRRAQLVQEQGFLFDDLDEVA
jgi:adenine-specific DNA methylase